MALASPGRAIWAALLTPQGKWLADFFIFADADRLLIDCEAAQSADLARRLSRFRLRARAEIAAEPLSVYVAWGGPAPEGVGQEAPVGAFPLTAPDPRLEAAGWRILTSGPQPVTATPLDYDRHRLSLGLPDGSRDMEAEKSVLLEAGFDELGGVSWTKGCYLGQELTARTKYRGLIKRRLLPVSAAGVLPPSGTPILLDGAEVGSLRSVDGNLGLAQLRLDALGGPLQCGGAAVVVHVPSWMHLSKAG